MGLCPNCGKEIIENISHCPYCEKKLKVKKNMKTEFPLLVALSTFIYAFLCFVYLYFTLASPDHNTDLSTLHELLAIVLLVSLCLTLIPIFKKPRCFGCYF